MKIIFKLRLPCHRWGAWKIEEVIGIFGFVSWFLIGFSVSPQVSIVPKYLYPKCLLFLCVHCSWVGVGCICGFKCPTIGWSVPKFVSSLPQLVSGVPKLVSSVPKLVSRCPLGVCCLLQVSALFGGQAVLGRCLHWPTSARLALSRRLRRACPVADKCKICKKSPIHRCSSQ